MASEQVTVCRSNGPRWLLGGSVLLALAVYENDGQYTPIALVLALGAFCFLGFAIFALGRERRGPGVVTDRELLVALLLVLLVGAYRAPGLWLHDPTIIAWERGWRLGLAVTATVIYALFPGGWSQRMVFGGAVVAAFAFRVWMLRASPSPLIDVFELAQQGSAYLLKGWNPYVSPIAATGFDGHIYTFEGYAYPPGGLLVQSVFFALTGDARSANVAGDLLFAFILWKLASQLPATTRELLTLLFLYHPRALFVLENAWTEPIILGLFGAALWACRRGASSSASAILGFVFGMKHYLVFVAGQYLMVERRRRAWLLLASVGLLSVMPFVLADPGSFWRNGLLLVVSLPFSDQSLGVVAPVYRWTGWTPGPALSIATGLGSMALFPWLLRGLEPLARFSLATTATLFCTFLFGSKAFGNYYYLVGGLWLASLVLCMSQSDDGPAASADDA